MFCVIGNSKSKSAAKVTVCLVALSLLQANSAFGFGFTKRPSFDLPNIGKLGDDSQANQSQTQAPATDANTSTSASKPPDLSPVTLGDPNATPSQDTTGGGTTSTDGTLLKSTVTTTSFMPKAPDATTVQQQAESVIHANSKDPLEQAKQVNAMPLPLVESDSEQDKKIDAETSARRVQLGGLWESTLSRSPQIQFVLQKLMPSSDPGKTSSILMHSLSTLVFGAMGAATMMAPNMGTYAAQSAGASLMMNALGMQDQKRAKNAKITQEEMIMFYNTVHQVADTLTDCYGEYKKFILQINGQTNDLQDLRQMVADTRDSQDAAKQLDMEYTLRKQQRDIEVTGNELKTYRQKLVDLAGSDAVAKLDKQIDEEQIAIAQKTSTSQSPDGTQATPSDNTTATVPQNQDQPQTQAEPQKINQSNQPAVTALDPAVQVPAQAAATPAPDASSQSAQVPAVTPPVAENDKFQQQDPVKTAEKPTANKQM